MSMPNVDALAESIDNLTLEEYMAACPSMVTLDIQSLIEKYTIAVVELSALGHLEERDELEYKCAEFLNQFIK